MGMVNGNQVVNDDVELVKSHCKL